MRILIFFILLLTVFVSNQTFAQEAEGKLHLVQKIHIGEMGKSDESERFQLLLEEQLEKNGFTVVSDADKADAIYNGSFITSRL